METEITQMHSMFRGDVSRIQKTLSKKHIKGIVLNEDKAIQFMQLPISCLKPLLTQRETKETWVQSRLEDLKGFDMLAAGALQVAHDPNDNEYYVFDGCGRLAQAQANEAPLILPCLVYDITKEQAAFYFSYNQDKGRRNLSKEIIFVNSFYSGDKDSLLWADRLSQINCFIKGTTDYAVPQPQIAGHPEIKVSALKKGWSISNGDISLMKQVRDMICMAWGGTQSGVSIIRQDLFLGLITFLKVYPKSQKNNLNVALQSFLNATATLTPQNKLDWKNDGGNRHNHEATSVAYGLLKAFKRSQFYKQQFNNDITEKALHDYAPQIFDTDDE